MTPPKQRELKLAARIIVSGADALSTCANCQKPEEEHAGSKCLFEPTTWAQNEVKQILIALLEDGGEMTITTATGSISQRIEGGASVEELRNPTRIKTSFDTEGFAEVTLNTHAENNT